MPGNLCSTAHPPSPPQLASYPRRPGSLRSGTDLRVTTHQFIAQLTVLGVLVFSEVKGPGLLGAADRINHAFRLAEELEISKP